MAKWVVEDRKVKHVYWPSDAMKKRAWISDESFYREGQKDPVKFWEKRASEALDWKKKWKHAYQQGKKPWQFKWFVGAEINACYNALDRHIKAGSGDREAIVWVPEPTDDKPKTYTYKMLYDEVNRLASAMKKLGVRKGDRVSIYLPMIPEVVISMLATSRLGAIHSVCFSAFSGESLRDRVDDANSKLIITADGYYRRGKPLDLKKNADIGASAPSVKHVIVVKRTRLDVAWNKKKDLWYHELLKKADKYCEPTFVESNEKLFLLYTSGTTGKPKGIVHDTGGYLTQAYWTTKLDFDLHDSDLFWCTADVGWVTGHTYGCYGPLLLGARMLMFEGAPDYPDPGRWWKIVADHKVTVFYTAPTAIRMFIKFGDQWPEKYDLSTLRILGTVGEPIDVEAWMWYFRKIGGGRCPVIDTWWQTETGGTLINSLPGVGPFIPTVSGRMFPGTHHILLDEDGDEVKMGQGGYLAQVPPFAPGMLRGVYRNEKKYIDTYWSRFPGYYDTSDGAVMREYETIRVTGRVDDTMKVAGHRLSTAELENAINKHKLVRESAVVPKPHEIKGEVPVAFVLLKGQAKASDALKQEIVKHVDKMIGPTARPGEIYFVEDVPKTRSGKIMRRILRGLLKNDKDLGNLTTLMNPECVEVLKKIVGYKA
ncbi:MAG: acetate--CoA ligase [Candidatus Aenigmatarchaeota archaeon]|nr:MAG: acetate--CoA ligase [Candidatus Aenigmarchaeota archaeon]